MSAVSKVKLGWALAGGMLALVMSLVPAVVVIGGYAMFLGFQTRGAPDSTAISRFANSGTITWLGIAGTALGVLIGGSIAAHKARTDALVNSLAVGVIYSALILLSLPLGRGPAWLILLRILEALAICFAIGQLTSRRAVSPSPRVLEPPPLADDTQPGVSP